MSEMQLPQWPFKLKRPFATPSGFFFYYGNDNDLKKKRSGCCHAALSLQFECNFANGTCIARAKRSSDWSKVRRIMMAAGARCAVITKP